MNYGMISALDEFRAVIANLPTGPLAAGSVTHPRISVYAATAEAGDVGPVQAMVRAIAGGDWETQIAAIDADLRLYELAVAEPACALDEAEVANLISYGMTTVEPGVDVLGIQGSGIRDQGSGKAQLNLIPDICSLTSVPRDIPALFGAIIAARMAGIRVVLAGEHARVARELLRSMNPGAVAHCLEAAPGDFDEVFGLTGAIALLQAEP